MSTYYASLLAEAGILLLGALSVYIILATGQLSLGNAAFMAIGAYLTSYLTVEAGLPPASSASSSAFRRCGSKASIWPWRRSASAR
jgi:branched-chain amino acid transport system permease protein